MSSLDRARRSALLLLSVSPLVAACSEPAPRLQLGTAPAALCGGAATREDDGSEGSIAAMAVGVGPGAGPGSSSGSGQGEPPPDGVVHGAGGSFGEGGFGEGGFGEGGFGGSGGVSQGGGDQGGGGSGGDGAGGRGVGGAPVEQLGEARSALINGCAGVDLSKPTRLYLSSDDSNSMASPVIQRKALARGATVLDPRTIRVHEFLNYYRFGFEPAPEGKLSDDLALQIAVQSSASTGPRPPMSVTLVLDDSGSMSGEPLALAQAAVRAIAATLVEGDVVNAVTWSTGQLPVLQGHVVSGPDDPTLLAVAEGMNASGGTDLNGGLRAGYALAEQHRAPGRIHRVVLISDGVANVGVTEEELIGAHAEDQDGEGIYLVGVGVGDGVNDTLMDVVTDAGRGAYIYLDSEEEARRIFVDRFAETMLVAARDVRIELTLPAYFGIAKFYGEEYSPDPSKVRTQHLAPDDSMMLYQILRPCDPSLPRAGDPYMVKATWKDPLTGESRQARQETTLGELGIDDGRLGKAAAIVAYAEALKQLVGFDAETRIQTLTTAQQAVTSTFGAESDPDLVEIRGHLQRAIDNQERDLER
jgi:Ca-activated chloride channel family protein